MYCINGCCTKIKSGGDEDKPKDGPVGSKADKSSKDGKVGSKAGNKSGKDSKKM